MRCVWPHKRSVAGSGRPVQPGRCARSSNRGGAPTRASTRTEPKFIVSVGMSAPGIDHCHAYPVVATVPRTLGRSMVARWSIQRTGGHVVPTWDPTEPTLWSARRNSAGSFVQGDLLFPPVPGNGPAGAGTPPHKKGPYPTWTHPGGFAHRGAVCGVPAGHPPSRGVSRLS